MSDRMLHTLGARLAGLASIALVTLLLPAAAFGGAVITPVPTFPYPSVVLNQAFPASITLFNNSTGQDAQAGVTIAGSNLDLFPSCPASVISSNDCPTAEAGVFSASATGSSGDGLCPAGTWTITQPAPARLRFTPPGPIGLQPFEHCTVNFTATAVNLPQFDAALAVPGVQTNQVAAIDAFSPVSGLTVRNSGSSSTTVLGPPSSSGGPSNSPQAKLRVSEGCKRIATARVTGQEVQRVSFLVDGKRLATVSKAPFQTRIATGRFSAGRHKLTAAVSFTQSSGTLSESLRGGFLRCRVRRVSYTG